MQTVETLNEGLKRAFRITIPAKDIDARVDAELKSIAPQVRMPGFRPGKVPANLIRKMHGEALRREAMQEAINEAVNQLMTDRGIRPAMLRVTMPAAQVRIVVQQCPMHSGCLVHLRANIRVAGRTMICHAV